GNAAKPAREQLTLLRCVVTPSDGPSSMDKRPPPMSRLSFAPGEAYQFDWSHEAVLLSGATVIVDHPRAACNDWRRVRSLRVLLRHQRDPFNAFLRPRTTLAPAKAANCFSSSALRSLSVSSTRFRRSISPSTFIPDRFTFAIVISGTETV